MPSRSLRVKASRRTPFAFAYAIALAMDSEYEEAHRFGRLAVGLAERASNPAQESRALMVLGGHVSPWRAPLRDSVPLLRRAYTRGIESGELEYAAYALANLVFALWFRGAPLDTVLTETDAALAFYRRIGHLGRSLRRAVHARREVPERPDARLRALRRRRVRRGGIPARDGRERARTGRLPRAAGAGCYLLDEPALALSYARKGERWLPYLRTIFFQADHFFYSALALSSLHDGASPASRTRSSRSCAGTTAGSSSGPDSRPPRSGTSRTWSRRRSRASSGVPT